ncbi:MAG TPA: MFS transporter [Candidatus Bathyarchaeia archaeon]|nr:MFS transporter [Candidatus Bathyarchaeia archaeon]
MKYKWVVLTVTTVGVLMDGIDSRIVIIGLPQVAAALHADIEQAIWFTQSYVLASTIALLLIGRLTDMVGRVKIYTIGFAIFTIGSALTSIAQNPAQFILWRGLQGLGVAMLFTNSVAMIVDATPTNELGFSLGVNQIAFRFGAMAGLTISGLILSFLDWRALFYVNIPIGIFGTFWSHHRLKEIAKVEKKTTVDWFGFVSFSIAITSFLLALTYAAYGLSEDFVVYSLLILSAVSLAIFVLHERKQKHPLLDLSLLKIREFTGGLVAQLLNAIAWGAFLLLLSLYFQLILDMSPLDAGIRIIPFDIAFLVAGPLSGRFSDRYGHLPFTTTGLILTSLSLFLFSTVGIATPISFVFVYMMILGVGMGLFVSPNISSIMGSVPEKRRGIASAFRATFFQVGFVISINVAVLIMTFVVPYQTITQVVSSVNPISLSASDKRLFIEGLGSAHFWLAIVNLAAIPPSVLRGNSKRMHDTLLEKASSVSHYESRPVV